MQGVKLVTRRDLGMWDGVRAERWSVGKPLTSPGAGDAAFPCMGSPCPTHAKQPKSCFSITKKTFLGGKRHIQGG